MWTKCGAFWCLLSMLFPVTLSTFVKDLHIIPTVRRLLLIIAVPEIAAVEQYRGDLKKWWGRHAPLSSPATLISILQQHDVSCVRWRHNYDDAWVWAGLTGVETRTAHACWSILHYAAAVEQASGRSSLWRQSYQTPPSTNQKLCTYAPWPFMWRYSKLHISIIRYLSL